MAVPVTLRGLFRQRLRWGRGLVQVLLQHGGIPFHWRKRRHWPVMLEAVISIIWWHLLVPVLVPGLTITAVDIDGYEQLQPFPWGWVAPCSPWRSCS